MEFICLSFWWIAWSSLFVKMCVGNKSNNPRAETMAESRFLPYHILTNNPEVPFESQFDGQVLKPLRAEQWLNM
jgi:hypothetical protein